MKKYKRVIILMTLFLIITVVSCTRIVTDEINIVDMTHNHYKVDPKGQLIVNAEIGEVSVKKTDRLTDQIDVDIKKEWKSGMMFQPN